MTAFTLQLKDGRVLNRQHRSALLVSSTSWTGSTYFLPFETGKHVDTSMAIADQSCLCLLALIH